MRDGLTVDTATDVLLAAYSDATYVLLTKERGWTHEQTVEWFCDALPGCCSRTSLSPRDGCCSRSTGIPVSLWFISRDLDRRTHLPHTGMCRFLCEEVGPVATNLAIDPALLDRAVEVSGAKTKKEAVTIALKEMIARRAQVKLLELEGTVEWDPDYDYKAERSRDYKQQYLLDE